MIKRIITAVIGIPLVILLVKAGGDMLFFAAVSAVIALALKEFFDFIPEDEPAIGKWLAIIMGCLVPVCTFFGIISAPGSSVCLNSVPSDILVVCFIVFFCYYVIRSDKAGNSFNLIAEKFFGIFYVAVLLSYLLLIKAQTRGEDLLLFLLFVTWAGDIGAYFIGTWIGKRPLAPVLSPKKTVEGAVGSIISSVAVAVLCRTFFLNSLDLTNCIVMGLGINILNQFGDLSESMIKRAYKVKDSGNIIPGHGGVLDRVDSLIFATPFLYYYVKVLITDI